MENEIKYKTSQFPFILMRIGEFIFKWGLISIFAGIAFGFYFYLLWLIPVRVQHDDYYFVWGGIEQLLASIHIISWIVIGLIYYFLHFHGDNYSQDRDSGRNC